MLLKRKADESYQISTTDIESLTKLVEKKHVDGIFCGPSEFNIVNTMNLCESVNLPFYISREQWDLCSNKLSFKKIMQRFLMFHV